MAQGGPTHRRGASGAHARARRVQNGPASFAPPLGTHPPYFSISPLFIEFFFDLHAESGFLRRRGPRNLEHTTHW